MRMIASVLLRGIIYGLVLAAVFAVAPIGQRGGVDASGLLAAAPYAVGGLAVLIVAVLIMALARRAKR